MFSILIVSLCLLSGGCSQPFFIESGHFSGDDSDKLWGPAETEYGGAPDLTPDGYDIELQDGDTEGTWNNGAADFAGPVSTDSIDTGYHDPECGYQYHGPDFCGDYAQIGYVNTDDLYGNVEIEIDVYYHCFISVIISDASGKAVAVLNVMEDMPGDPAFETLLPGELNPNLEYDPTYAPDMYQNGPSPQYYYYTWDGVNEQTGFMVPDLSYYYVNLYIFFSPDSDEGLPMATDTEEFFYDAFFNNLDDA